MGAIGELNCCQLFTLLFYSQVSKLPVPNLVRSILNLVFPLMGLVYYIPRKIGKLRGLNELKRPSLCAVNNTTLETLM